MECAATNYCFDNGRCIFRDNHIYTGGLIATIALSVAVVTTVVLLLIFYIRDKKAQRLARKEIEDMVADQKLRVAHTRAIERAEVAKILREQEDADVQAKIRDSDHRRALENQGYLNPFADGRA
jgi:hypothetical protein